MEFKLKTYHRNTPSEVLLADVQSVAAELKKNTLTMPEYEIYGKYHPHTLQKRFGSWYKVLVLAKLDAKIKKYIPEEELYKNIEEVWISLGRQPKYSEMKAPLSKYSTNPYENHFGTWGQALEQFVNYINSDNFNENENLLAESEQPQNDSTRKEITHKTKRDISDRLRFRILMRDGFTCRKCGKSPMKTLGIELHIDHIIPWSKGGETIPENLETKCQQCNLGKGNAFDV
jgi:hypothetical protein